MKIFEKRCTPSGKCGQMNNLKSCDNSIIAPCKDVLEQKILTCDYVAYMWRHAYLQNPLPDTPPTMHGWQESVGLYLPARSTGSQVPKNLAKTINSSDISKGNTIWCYQNKSHKIR